MEFRRISCRVFRSIFLLGLVGWMLSTSVAAQTFSVLHNFSGGGDGANPIAGPTLDAGGNLYGTTFDDGAAGLGTAFKLTHRNSAWILTTLHSFGDYPDGEYPTARVVFGPGGALYGTTLEGGRDGVGTVFKLQPRINVCPTVSCPWTETMLYSFKNVPDAAYPAYGDVVFDAAGNLYGAAGGGTSGYTCADDSPCGTVYELMRVQNGWNESVIWNFEGDDDGAFPNGVIVDSSGSVYGTTSFRGVNVRGTVFSLTSNGQGWAENSLYSFSGGSDGAAPEAGVISDGAGGFFGTTGYDGSGNGGTVFQLSSLGGNWLLNTLTSFNFSGTLGVTPPGPQGVLVMDANGNLYGATTLAGAYNQGSVFKMTPSGGGWTLTTLHDFTGGADGGQPVGQVVLDASGNIFGTASVGGSSVGSCYQGLGCGVVFEIIP
jgi:uncharacterized repeat protein (TIGR03803 family)